MNDKVKNHRQNEWRVKFRNLLSKRLLFTIMLLLGTITALYAQERTKITFKSQNAIFRVLADAIKNQTDYDLVYNADAMPFKTFVLNSDNREVKSVLDEVAPQLGLEYTIKKKVITVRVKQQPKKQEGISGELKGHVNDEGGVPLPGVSVKLKNTNKGASTDLNGNFTIKLAPDEKPILQVSMIGMESKEVKVTKESDLYITLKEDSEVMDEVVVIGYGSVARQDMTGAVSSLDTKIIESSAAPNLTSMIQGQIPGLSVSLGDGSPGSSAQIEIRGASSLTGSNAPLIVVDDIPMSSDYDINMLNPYDIKSLNVLKGASASAIYGSRASGGVIVITTKMGTRNAKPVINYSFDLTNKFLMDGLRTLSADEFKMLMFEAARNEARAQGYDDVAEYDAYKKFATPGFFGEANTPWMSMLMQDAVTQQHRVSLQGGTSSSSYNASFSFVDEQGMIKSIYNRRYTYSAGFNTDLNDKLKATISLGGSFQQGNRNVRGMETAIAGRPDTPVYTEDGSYYHQTYTFGNRVYTMRNPLAEIEGTRELMKKKNLNASATLDWRPLPSLGLSARYSYQTYIDDTDLYKSSETYEGTDNWSGNMFGYGRRTNYNSAKQELEFRGTFSKLFFKEHFLNLVAVATYTEDDSENYWFAMQNYGDDNVQNGIWQGVDSYDKYPKDGYSNGSLMISFISRLEYKFRNRYILNASMRRDGSSRFSPKERWGNFPAFAAAWLVSEEKFVKKNVPWLTYLKLKGGWGKVGNGWVPEYAWRTMFNTTNYMGQAGIVPETIGNDNLRWEDTEAWDLGLEFGLFEGQRIRGNLGFYRKKTEGLLYDLELAPSLGMRSTRVNFASIENKGVEFDVTARIIETKDWQWQCTLNLFKNKNTVTNIDGDFVSTPGSSAIRETIIKEGASLGLIYGFRTNGVFKSQEDVDWYEGLNADHAYQTGTSGRRTIPGDLKYVDGNGDGWVNIATNAHEDRAILGCSRPDFEGGFSTRLGYKGFTLSVQSSFAYGFEKYWKAAANQFQFNANSPENVLDLALNRWTPENPDATYPSMRLNSYMNEVVDRYVFDASYWKIQNVELAYRVPTYWIKRYTFFSSAALSFSINNVAIFTSYPGPSPESFSSNVIAGGSVDYSTYPQTRNFNFSIKVSL